MGDVIAFAWLSRNWTTLMELDPRPWEIGEYRNYGPPGTIWAREADANHMLLKPYFNLSDAHGPILGVFEVDDIERHDDYLIHARRRRLLNARDFSAELLELAARLGERELVLRLRQDRLSRDPARVEARARFLHELRGGSGDDDPWGLAARARTALLKMLSSAGPEIRQAEDQRAAEQFEELVLDSLFPSWRSNLLPQLIPAHPDTEKSSLERTREDEIKQWQLSEANRLRAEREHVSIEEDRARREQVLQEAIETLLPEEAEQPRFRSTTFAPEEAIALTVSTGDILAGD